MKRWLLDSSGTQVKVNDSALHSFIQRGAQMKVKMKEPLTPSLGGVRTWVKVNSKKNPVMVLRGRGRGGRLDDKLLLQIQYESSLARFSEWDGWEMSDTWVSKLELGEVVSDSLDPGRFVLDSLSFSWGILWDSLESTVCGILWDSVESGQFEILLNFYSLWDSLRFSWFCTICGILWDSLESGQFVRFSEILLNLDSLWDSLWFSWLWSCWDSERFSRLCRVCESHWHSLGCEISCMNEGPSYSTHCQEEQWNPSPSDSLLEVVQQEDSGMNGPVAHDLFTKAVKR